MISLSWYCPHTINILAENVFNASDKLLVPLMPTTLAVRSYEQLLTFLRKNDGALDQISAFFSMVDGRKRLHSDVMTLLRGENNSILQTFIPFLSQIEQMGLFREPVPSFAPRSTAALAYQALWAEIQQHIDLPLRSE